eukprot:TRINITY_DN17932_c0_g1_i1.p1 TRINITY_DN17932_c0_g1~~TRINITY_DN17932_c0_g1_i1.p1  ORF type:complete len:252 (-),score=53.21 TRINITY_DN17932_c0_g1_i1:264-1019(-)
METIRTELLKQWGISPGVDENLLVPHIAAERGDLNLFKEALKVGLDPNQKDGERGTLPLHWAVQKLSFDVAEYILKEKINDPNCRNFEGNTPLHYATVKGSKRMSQLLIEHGAEVNAVNDSRQIPLFGAVFERYDHVIEYLALLRDPKCHACKKKRCAVHRADLDFADEDGNTALHLAGVHHWGNGTYNLLVQLGADETIKNKEGKYPVPPMKIVHKTLREITFGIISVLVIILAFWWGLKPAEVDTGVYH